MAQSIIDQIKAARRASVPILAINTPDPAATIDMVVDGINGQSPKLVWDVVRGMKSRNHEGAEALANLVDDPDMAGSNVAIAQGNPTAALQAALDLPAKSILFIQLANRWISDPGWVQACWNIRDQFKDDSRRTLILLGPSIQLPAELAGDVVVIDEPLPDETQLREIVADIHKAGDCPLTDETLARSVEALQGLSAFTAEQVTAMSLKPEGVDLDGLWERKRQQIEQTRGLKVDRCSETFDDIGGLSQIKKFGEKLFSGPHSPAVVCRVEEIEKVMGGAETDSSGTSQDALQVLLTEMEDNEWVGIIAFGPPGSGKSLFSKSLANTFGRLSVSLDLNAAKDGLVGSSEANIRQAMKVLKSIGGKQVFFVASANKMNTIPPELRRRFRYGVWMFDVVDGPDKDRIWEINQEKYGIPANAKRPNDKGFTGADIRSVCELAWAMGCPLSEAVDFMSPLCRTSPDAIDTTRRIANGRFMCAAKPGVYSVDSGENKTGRRKVSVEQES